MEHKSDRLVERIFGRRKGVSGEKALQGSSLFRSGAAAQVPAGRFRFRRGAKKGLSRPFPLGLDMGSRSIRWVRLEKVEDAFRVGQVGFLPVSSPVGGGDPQALSPVRRALQEMKNQADVGTEVSLSLPVEEVNLQFLKMPVLPADQMESAVRLQVEQTLPPNLSSDDISMDYIVVEEDAVRMEARVLVASVPKQRVVERVEHLKAVGLAPVAVEMDPLAAVAGLVWQQALAPQETVLLLHLGETSASFSVIVNQRVMFSRSVLTTGETLVQSVCGQMGIPPDQAEVLLRQYGVVGGGGEGGGSQEQTLVAGALASPLENLVVDVLHSFKSFSYQMMQSKVQRFDRLLLSGREAHLPGLAPWLKTRVGVSVEVAQPLRGLPLPESVTASHPWNETPAAFVVAAGLALREIQAP